MVTYRSGPTIEECLRSLRTASKRHELRVVVLDNASGDDTAARARAADPAATVIERASNDGYAAACNEGLERLGEVDWVLFANPDTVWSHDALDDLVAVAAASPGAGILSPMLVDLDGAPQPMIERDLTLGRVLRGMLRLGPPVRPDRPPADGAPVAVEWLHTAAALLPAEVARRTGGFDPRFFLFAEDADLCRRVRALGLEVLVVPAVRVTHAGGASVDASTDAAGAAALRVRAVGTYLEKHEGRLARRVFGAIGAATYGIVGHRAQAKAAWVEGAPVTRRVVIAIPCHRDEPNVAATVQSLAASAETVPGAVRIVVCVNGRDPGSGPAAAALDARGAALHRAPLGRRVEAGRVEPPAG